MKCCKKKSTETTQSKQPFAGLSPDLQFWRAVNILVVVGHPVCVAKAKIESDAGERCEVGAKIKSV